MSFSINTNIASLESQNYLGINSDSKARRSAAPRTSPLSRPPKLRLNALATSIAPLGTAQAVVCRGENQFNFAVNLAQSQLTNTTTAESRIRDADLASEAANLTKAQILLQAGVAALAQANPAPQAVLALLN